MAAQSGQFSFDGAYVDRLRQGDLEAQRHFVSYFSDLLRAKLRHRLRAAHLVEEARQETFLRVFLVLRERGVDHPERLGAFVNSVCNNVVFEMYRSESRTAQFPESFNPQDPSVDIERDLVSGQRQSMVREILNELPEKERDLLRRAFLEEEDKDDICRSMGVDREYLRVLLHRARKRFGALLQQRGKSARAGG